MASMIARSVSSLMYPAPLVPVVNRMSRFALVADRQPVRDAGLIRMARLAPLARKFGSLGEAANRNYLLNASARIGPHRSNAHTPERFAGGCRPVVRRR